MTTSYAISTDGLTKRFGNVTAVSQLDLCVQPGEVFGFLGPNGAGKSTTIALLLALLRPTAGTVRVLGRDPADAADALGGRVGVLPERCELFPRLTAQEHLAFALAVTGAEGTPGTVLERVGLDEAGARRAGGYSTGMAQRLRLALALVGRPDLLILDEPATGLDPNGIARLRRIVRGEAARGATVFFSSHRLDQVQAVCDRVGILVDGRLRTTAHMDTFDGGPTRLRLAVSQPTPVLDRFRGREGVDALERENGRVVLTVTDPSRAERIREEASGLEEVESVQLVERSLEKLFARLTGGHT